MRPGKSFYPPVFPVGPSSPSVPSSMVSTTVVVFPSASVTVVVLEMVRSSL